MGGVVFEVDVDLEEKVEEEIVVEETVVVENNDQKYLEMLESLANLSNTILDLNLTIVEWTMRLDQQTDFDLMIWVLEVLLLVSLIIIVRDLRNMNNMMTELREKLETEVAVVELLKKAVDAEQ